MDLSFTQLNGTRNNDKCPLMRTCLSVWWTRENGEKQLILMSDKLQAANVLILVDYENCPIHFDVRFKGNWSVLKNIIHIFLCMYNLLIT